VRTVLGTAVLNVTVLFFPGIRRLATIILVVQRRADRGSAHQRLQGFRQVNQRPAIVIETVREQYARLGALDEQIRGSKFDRSGGDDGRCESPQVGPRICGLAWIGAATTGTGGRVRLLGISKRGDKYLHTLLIHGARAVLTHSKLPPERLSELLKRRPKNVAVVAMANKMARTI
jgi:transposase